MPMRPDVDTTPVTWNDEGTTLDLLGLIFLFIRHWRRIALFTGAAFVLGAIVAFVLKPTYTATALILPPQQEQSSASSLLGSLMLLGGGGGAGGLLKSPGDMYVGVLKSNTIADELIKKFNLQKVYHAKTLDETRLDLEKNAEFESKKDGLIHISVKDHSPERASDLANGFIDALYRMNSTLALTDAAQRRLFFQKEVDEERQALNKAEEALATMQSKTGVIQLTGQADLLLSTMAEIQARITLDQVTLEGLLTSATNENPNVQRLKREIAGLRAELEKLQHSRRKLTPGDTQVPASRIPKIAVEYTRRLREVKYHETLFDLLSKQYEAARIDEAKSAPLIQVVDQATPPEKKSGPPRLLIILGAVFLGLLLGCLSSLASEYYKRLRATPEFQERLRQLREPRSQD